jgi:hypothetical protein
LRRDGLGVSGPFKEDTDMRDLLRAMSAFAESVANIVENPEQTHS